MHANAIKIVCLFFKFAKRGSSKQKPEQRQQISI